MELLNVTNHALRARVFVPGVGYGPSVRCILPDRLEIVKGPALTVMLLHGDQHMPIAGEFTIDPEFHNPDQGMLKVAPQEQCIHTLPDGKILQVWVMGENPKDVAAR